MKSNNSNELRNLINNLNIEIKSHFHYKKSNSVRRNIIPGNTKTLWDAVNIAKDLNTPKLPDKMYHNNTLIVNDELPDTFAESFVTKVKAIIDQQTISETLYNGTQKIISTPLDL